MSSSRTLMAYAPNIAIGRCASSAHGPNWESVMADLGNADNREKEQNHVAIKYASPNMNLQDSAGITSSRFCPERC